MCPHPLRPDESTYDDCPVCYEARVSVWLWFMMMRSLPALTFDLTFIVCSPGFIRLL